MSDEQHYPEVEEAAVEVVSSEVLYEQGRAEVDIQVSTAKKYPRNVSRCISNATAIVTISESAARTCSYSLPRGGKTVTGPTIHLAKILAQQYGNLRCEAKVVDITEKHIRCQAVAWDIETNVAVKVEVLRKITDKYGKKFNDDMVTMTGNAGNAIALRNAIFAVVPKQVVDAVYQAAQRKITGDLSDADKLNAKRLQVVTHLKSSYNLTETQVLAAIGKSSINHITPEDIVTLTGVDQAIKDGDTNVQDAFSPGKSQSEGRGAAAVSAAQEAISKAKK
jgi:ribosomal protein L18